MKLDVYQDDKTIYIYKTDRLYNSTAVLLCAIDT